jgi:hypothetical protein
MITEESSSSIPPPYPADHDLPDGNGTDYDHEAYIAAQVAAKVREWEMKDNRDRWKWTGEPRPANGPDDYGADQEREAKAASEIKLTFFNDCGAFVAKRWIIKDVIAYGETSAWIAPPGYGKSALLAEIAVHAAAVMPWRGNNVKDVCGVVFLAFERADLCKRRLYAYQLRDGLVDLPIAVHSGIIDLMSPTCVDIIGNIIVAAAKGFGIPVGMLVIDTFNKGIAAGGGDEDKARDQNRAAANLRRIQEKFGVHFALVGHTGKDQTRGARGSNAHLGDVDVMVQISGDAVKVADIVKNNDGDERLLAQFRMEPVELDIDEDGKARTVAIVSTDMIVGGPQAKPKSKLSDKNKAALDALFECIADGETAPRPENVHVPVGVTGVTLATWKNRLAVTAVINPDGNHREEFKRIHVTLRNARRIGIWDNFVWPVT